MQSLHGCFPGPDILLARQQLGDHLGREKSGNNKRMCNIYDGHYVLKGCTLMHMTHPFGEEN